MGKRYVARRYRVEQFSNHDLVPGQRPEGEHQQGM